MATKEDRELQMLDAMSKAGVVGPNYTGTRKDKETQGIMEM
jgi:hypothetical protein